MNSRLDDEYEQWLLQAQTPKRGPGKKGKGDRRGKKREDLNRKAWFYLGGLCALILLLFLAYWGLPGLLKDFYHYQDQGYHLPKAAPPPSWDTPSFRFHRWVGGFLAFLLWDLPAQLNIFLVLVIALLLLFPELLGTAWGIIRKAKGQAWQKRVLVPIEKREVKGGWITFSWLVPLPLFWGLVDLSYRLRMYFERDLWNRFMGAIGYPAFGDWGGRYMLLAFLICLTLGLLGQRKGNSRHIWVYLIGMILLFPIPMVILAFVYYFRW
jgi:hypothetical protein